MLTSFVVLFVVFGVGLGADGGMGKSVVFGSEGECWVWYWDKEGVIVLGICYIRLGGIDVREVVEFRR